MYVTTIKFRVFKGQRFLDRYFDKAYHKWTNKEFKDKLVITNISGLSDWDNHKDLYFEIEAPLQGLVAKCLNNFQIGKTRNTKFCLCFPLFNRRNEIATIISMDSEYCIRIPEELDQSVADTIAIFTQELEKYFPKLFK